MTMPHTLHHHHSGSVLPMLRQAPAVGTAVVLLLSGENLPPSNCPQPLSSLRLSRSLVDLIRRAPTNHHTHTGRRLDRYCLRCMSQQLTGRATPTTTTKDSSKMVQKTMGRLRIRLNRARNLKVRAGLGWLAARCAASYSCGSTDRHTWPAPAPSPCIEPLPRLTSLSIDTYMETHPTQRPSHRAPRSWA